MSTGFSLSRLLMVMKSFVAYQFYAPGMRRKQLCKCKSHAREKPLLIMHTECISFKQEPVSVKQGSREYDHSWQLY